MHSTTPKLAGRSLNVLLYADDAALLARSPIGLRRMLQALHEYCDQHELQPNYAKTKIMVFEIPSMVDEQDPPRAG